jgi:hypothetical protein
MISYDGHYSFIMGHQLSQQLDEGCLAKSCRANICRITSVEFEYGSFIAVQREAGIADNRWIFVSHL